MSEKRGSTNNKNRLDAFSGKSGAGRADWGTCNPALLLEVVKGITSKGGAVTIGMARDMGAHSLTLLLDKQRTTLWFNGNADLDEELGEVINTLKGLPD